MTEGVARRATQSGQGTQIKGGPIWGQENAAVSKLSLAVALALVEKIRDGIPLWNAMWARAGRGRRRPKWQGEGQ